MTDKERAEIAKTWLMRSIGSRRYKREIERRLEAFTFASIAKYETDGSGKGTPRENEQETKMIEYSDLRKTLEGINRRLDAEDTITIRVIEAIRSETAELERAILMARYINMRTWDEIASSDFDEPLSNTQAYRIHGKALISMYKAMKEEGYA